MIGLGGGEGKEPDSLISGKRGSEEEDGLRTRIVMINAGPRGGAPRDYTFITYSVNS